MTITITEYRNAISLDPSNMRIDVEINHPEYGWLPYTVNPSDTDMTIDNSALLALIGKNFAAYVAPTEAELAFIEAIKVRNQRNMKLEQEVDLVAGNPLRWADLTIEKQAEWAKYRTDLLNVPQQAGFPNTINWPTKPE